MNQMNLKYLKYLLYLRRRLNLKYHLIRLNQMYLK